MSEPSIRMGKFHEPLVRRTGAEKTLGRTLCFADIAQPLHHAAFYKGFQGTKNA